MQRFLSESNVVFLKKALYTSISVIILELFYK